MPAKEKGRSRVYLNNVHLKGYKSIEDLTIDFKKGLNILIGKNGAGKSNFLEFVNQLLTSESYSKVSHKSAHIEFNTDENNSFVFENEKEFNVKNGREHLPERSTVSERFFKNGKNIYDATDKFIDYKDDNLRWTGIAAGFFRTWVFQNIDPTFIKYTFPNDLGCINFPGTLTAQINEFITWDFPETLQFIERAFSDLEAFIDNLEREILSDLTAPNIINHLTIPEQILTNLKLYTAIEDLRFNNNINIYSEDKTLVVENIKLDFKLNDNWLPWSQLSDGTKRLFYIISEVTCNTGLVLIEEPELGIHPHQFNLLMDFLKEQSEEKQIIISTHSPKALDHLSPDELGNILIAYYDTDKGTQIRHLTEKEEKKAKRYMKEVGFFSDYWMLSDLE